VAEFPSIFGGVIRAMDGEKFHIYLINNAKPFYVTPLPSIPFAYCDKLAAELEGPLRHLSSKRGDKHSQKLTLPFWHQEQ